MQIEKNWYYWPLNRTSNTAGAIRYFNTVLLWRTLQNSYQISKCNVLAVLPKLKTNIFAIFLGFSLYKSLYKRMETGGPMQFRYEAAWARNGESEIGAVHYFLRSNARF